MISLMKQDISLALEALKSGNTELVNVAGNRITSNSLILETPKYQYIGFIVKEISSEYGHAKEVGEDEGKKSKEAGEQLLKEIQKILTNNFDGIQIWKKFSEYENLVRKNTMGDIERSIYKDNYDFTLKTRFFLVDYLIKNYSEVFEENCKLPLSVHSEMGRVINCYGFKEKDLAFFLVLTAFRHYYTYLRIEYPTAQDERKEELKKNITLLVEKIQRMFGNEDLTYDSVINSTIDLIGELGTWWRMGYLSFLEYRSIQTTQEIEKPKIPSEAKKKIEDVLIEGLQKELGKK